mgnify:CR=1 FL=1
MVLCLPELTRCFIKTRQGRHIWIIGNSKTKNFLDYFPQSIVTVTFLFMYFMAIYNGVAL